MHISGRPMRGSQKMENDLFLPKRFSAQVFTGVVGALQTGVSSFNISLNLGRFVLRQRLNLIEPGNIHKLRALSSRCVCIVVRQSRKLLSISSFIKLSDGRKKWCSRHPKNLVLCMQSRLGYT
jgi:hypothetical protein